MGAGGGEDGSHQGLSVRIQSKDVIGFVIPNFTQRTAFLEILRGQSLPYHGKAMIDGVDFSTPEGEALLGSIYYIGDQPDIFHGTILDNISMFRRVGHAVAMEAAQSLGVEPIIQALPQGYETRLGDIGASALPHDILQAISVIRAAAIKPRVLLLDIRRIPPDDVGTRACRRAIASLRGESTIVIVGRHKTEVEDADQIFGIQDWKLVDIQTLPGDARESGEKQLPPSLAMLTAKLAE
jgi:ATP-binding cassette subfamily C protein LapB